MTVFVVSPTLPHEFFVPGSPVSVNRYGTLPYKAWRADVHTYGTATASWAGSLVSGSCSVRIRYFRRLDRPKDVDNILKAIFDGLDGKTGPGPRATPRVLSDDRHVEHVVSQRTNMRFHTRFYGLRLEEYRAMLHANTAQAAVFVSVDFPPNHGRSVTR
ncbi:hypothetical protein AAIH70_25940 [Neorhizobium sp. BT27B]|uniref:hypothetical protein n=1 Tax=Neorhizobium sp. BT27B TaxID=3142625 RepID=UPI003D2C5A62